MRETRKGFLRSVPLIIGLHDASIIREAGHSVWQPEFGKAVDGLHGEAVEYLHLAI